MRFLLNLFKPKSLFKPTRKSLAWRLLDAYLEHVAMRGYIREHLDCNDRYASPSKNLIKRYGLSYESSNLAAWAILEKYVKGQLIENIATESDKGPAEHGTKQEQSY